MRPNPNRGRVYRRCGCRDTNGRQLGARCPHLANPRGVAVPLCYDGLAFEPGVVVRGAPWQAGVESRWRLRRMEMATGRFADRAASTRCTPSRQASSLSKRLKTSRSSCAASSASCSVLEDSAASFSRLTAVAASA